VSLEIENRFYEGYGHSEIDWSRPVHALLVDFKGDSMQLGKLLERLSQRGEQYVFVGNPLPFNGGWHFSTVNDFEHPAEQALLDPQWRNIRVWHRVNYVPTVAESGAPALTPREAFDPAQKQANAVLVHAGFRFTSVFLLGGLMPHTLIATALADNGPAGLLLAKHLELGATFAAVGHGLDVLIACGTPERSLVAGFEAAVFPKHDRLLEVSGLKKSAAGVCRYEHSTGAALVSASHCGPATFESWLEGAGLPAGPSSAGAASGSRVHMVRTSEPVYSLDTSRLPGMSGAVFDAGAEAPRVAVFADEVADPVEVYTIVSHLMQEKFSFQLISHSDPEGKVDTRRATTETVFGNAMYALRDCACVVTTLPANLVPEGTCFDGVFLPGGQCPYHLLQDARVTALLDAAPVAAAVCHGPEALAGSKWLREGDPAAGSFISYYGAWTSFRDVLHRYERKKPGEVCQDAAGRLFSGNAPNSTKEMTVRACAAIRGVKAAAGAPAP